MIKKREIVFEEVKGNLVSLMVTMRNGVHSWHLFKQVATYNLFKVTSPNVFTSIPYNNTINSLSLSLLCCCCVTEQKTNSNSASSGERECDREETTENLALP
jgi:hypothetical protein